MARIVTLSLNPTIDVSSEADLVRPTHKIRTTNEAYEPGGGGVNVARVVAKLGGDVEVLCVAGGVTGSFLDELLGGIALRRRLIPIAGNTRIALTVFERKTGHEFRFLPNGPYLSEREIAACLDAVRETEADYFVASGSIPLGAPPDVLAQVGRIVTERGARFVLDSSGVGLSGTLERIPVHLVKPSIGELEALVGRRLDAPAAEAAAMDLVERGRAEIVAVTMGAAGAIVATRDGLLRLKSPKVEHRSAVGAGDSFVAAMVVALSEGRSIEEAATFGIAAGAAAVMTPGTQLCTRDDIFRLYEEMRHRRHTGVEALAPAN